MTRMDPAPFKRRNPCRPVGCGGRTPKTNLMIRIFMKCSALILPALALAAPAIAATPPSRLPNIVIILADDLGYGDLGCYGGRAIATPNIDHLAAEGRRFTDGYAPAATCTPSRYSLMTGEYAWRQVTRQTTILNGDAPLNIEPGRLTLPSLLRNAGYSTGLVGKWHLGLGDGVHVVDFNGDIRPGPLEVGFDSAFFIPATLDRVPTVFVTDHAVAGLDRADPIQVSYVRRVGDEPTGEAHPDLLKMRADKQHSGTIVNGISRIGWMKGGHSARWVDEHIDQVLLAQAVRFIDRHSDHPFFLYYAAHEPHVPRAPDPRFVGATKLGRRGDSIAEFDWVTGQIMAALREAGVADNTLVILSSDNGPVLFDGYFDQARTLNGTHQPAGGLRGWKYLAYEGGTRVPLIVNWPGHVKPGVDDRMVCLTDFVATFAALTKQTMPAGAGVDSINQLPVITGEGGPALRNDVVEEGISGTLGLREGDWKFIPKTPGVHASGMGSGANRSDPRFVESIIKVDELFHLADDPAEKTNLAQQDPAKVASMRQRLEEIQAKR